MRIFANKLEITEVVEKADWAGDDKQVARTLTFTVAKSHSDPNMGSVTLNAGDFIIFQADDGTDLFWGPIFKPDRKSSASVVTYYCYDLLFYVLKSSGSWVIDETPEAFTARVCAEFGVRLKYAQETNVPVYSLALNKTGYQAIMMAYTEAYRQNNAKYAYIPLMERDGLMVIPKGMDSEVVLEPSENLMDASYSEDATKVVNKVIITDKNGNRVGVVQDAGSQAKYGTIQQVVTQEEGKDATAEAQKMLKELERAASISGISDYRARAGWSLLVREPDTGLYGRFTIKNDKHTFIDGKATMQLTVEFENTMDEHELEEGGK